MAFMRRRGISLLIPTQNAERTVELCIRSFAEFPDEMIVVDNGSTDNTKEIIRELESEFDHLSFFDAPQLKDLYENRQFAFEKSKFNWIVRIDSDYVAHTDGDLDIKILRKRILETKRRIRPIAFGITQVNLVHDFEHTGTPFEIREENAQAHADPPMNKLPARIIQWYPGMTFCRLGRWEGVRFQKWLKKETISTPHWFHCSFKSKPELLKRFFRTRWRETGDFDKYPNLDSYVKEQVPIVFGTDDLEAAAEQHYSNNLMKYLKKYDPAAYFPYPRMIAELLNDSKTD